MTCGLTEDELNVLHYFYANRNFNEKRSRSELAIHRDLDAKIVDVDGVLQSLQNKRYMGCKKKKNRNYWVAIGRTKSVLMAHDYPVDRSRRLL